MLSLAFAVIVTALLSSVLTWVLAWLWFRHHLAAQLQARLARLEDDFEARVKAGVLAAGEELLPKYRKAVAEGFTQAIADSPLSLAEIATRRVVKGAGFFGELIGLVPGDKK